MLRHDELGQETLLNLLLRNHLATNLYDQVQCRHISNCLDSALGTYGHSSCCGACRGFLEGPNCSIVRTLNGTSTCPPSPASRQGVSILQDPAFLFVCETPSFHCLSIFNQQAEALRSKAQRPETSRSSTQAARYLYYHGRIQAVQLDYTAARDSLQQASRKVCWDAGRAQSLWAQNVIRSATKAARDSMQQAARKCVGSWLRL